MDSLVSEGYCTEVEICTEDSRCFGAGFEALLVIPVADAAQDYRADTCYASGSVDRYLNSTFTETKRLRQGVSIRQVESVISAIIMAGR